VLVIQEIFGVNHYVRTRCADLAKLGYVAMAPDAFWRLERNVDLGVDEAALRRGLALGQQFDPATGVADLCAAFEHLRSLPETAGQRCGMVGFCFGGTMVFALASRVQADAVVSYYGSGVPGMLEQGGELGCPLLFHFGTKDAYIPAEAVARVGAFAAGRDNVVVRTYDAGHAFDNEFNSMFADPRAQAEAWGETRAFLGAHLLTGG
jgi:carboxymethylenebutenolidase